MDINTLHIYSMSTVLWKANVTLKDSQFNRNCLTCSHEHVFHKEAKLHKRKLVTVFLDMFEYSVEMKYKLWELKLSVSSVVVKMYKGLQRFKVELLSLWIVWWSEANAISFKWTVATKGIGNWFI